MAIRTEQDAFLQSISRSLDDNKNALTPGTVVHIDDAVAHTGPFYAVTALADAVVDVSECTTGIIENAGSAATQAVATNFTIPRGVTIYGTFTSIELDSGSVLAYAKVGVAVTVAAA